MEDLERVKKALVALTGEPLPADAQANFPSPDGALSVLCSANTSPIGFSQFNELLLYCGYHRVSADYFDYLVTGNLAPVAASNSAGSPHIRSIEDLEMASKRGQQLALLAFGHVKFGFKSFGDNPVLLRQWVEFLTPITADRFEHRLDPAVPIQDIEVSKRYLLGYLSGAEIATGLKANPEDQTLIALQQEQHRLQSIGAQNQNAYLVSDHLDIYVATSMRERHQFVSVATFCERLFADERLRTLKLRYFDPTLAYAQDRLDKGLSEALMLKRARVTIYLAQETETLGKDSELASTLAQGKVVVAYVPEPNDEYFADVESELQGAYPNVPMAKLLVGQLRHFQPQLAWEDGAVRQWLELTDDRLTEKLDEVRARFRAEVTKYHDKRYKTLRDDHPLGIQVNLRDGVAVGVLVVRSIQKCAELVRAILTNTLVYRLAEPAKAHGATHVCLVETISDSTFRVMTRDRMLENAFWNFYLQ